MNFLFVKATGITNNCVKVTTIVNDITRTQKFNPKSFSSDAKDFLNTMLKEGMPQNEIEKLISAMQAYKLPLNTPHNYDIIYTYTSPYNKSIAEMLRDAMTFAPTGAGAGKDRDNHLFNVHA